ncbi:MAG: amidohydrolase [Deltaproteobacteria bacterium]|jgi:5-methylthioadenosine/S-adenosylhomocysteine deaminase
MMKQDKGNKVRADLLVTGDYLLTFNQEKTVVEKGAVAVKGDRIAAIGEASNMAEKVEAREVLDASGCLIMPGLINLHTHGAMTCFRGLADDLPLQEWLHEHIFPAEASHLTEETVYWGTLLAAVEMIRSGTTTFCDGYFYEDGAARAVAASGIRGIVGQGVVDFPAPGVPDPRLNVKAAEAFVLRWQNKSPRLIPSVFCHSGYTCSPQTLVAAKTICSEHKIIFQIHLAENQAELEETQQRYGKRPVEHLLTLGILDGDTLCHHAVRVNEKEIETLAQSGVGISHNPESNMKLASGVAPLPKMLAGGVKVGLGTDGCASNNDLDLFQEMDKAAKLHKVHQGDPSLSSAVQIVEMATKGGAAALGMADILGSLEPGKKADLITIDLNQPHLTPMYEPCSHLVYAARGADVRDVIIDGRMVMGRRQLADIDEQEIMGKVREIADAIR